MKKSYIIALLIAVVVVLWILSGVIAPSSKGAGDTPLHSAGAETQITKVRVRSLVSMPFASEITLTGRSYASRRVDLKAETEGQITEIISSKGAVVAEGQVIAKLEERDRKARVNETSERLTQRAIEYEAAKSLASKGFNTKIKLAQASAELEKARADLKRAEIDLENTKITAPFDGIIYEQNIEIGDFVSPGSMTLSIVDLDPIEFRGFITEHNINEISQGGKAKAVLVNGQEVEGIISYIAPASSAETRTFAIEISADNPDNLILEGMTAQIIIPGAETKSHKISPSILSLSADGKVGVKIVDDDNKVLFVPVTIIADKPDHMIIGGLPDRIKLITVGQEFVIDGQLVEPVLVEGDGSL